MKYLMILVTAFLAVGCGKTANDGSGPKAATRPDGCPMYFAGERLCAALAWEGEPRSDRESAFRLNFWKPGRGSEKGPYTAPSKPVSTVLQMKSCGMLVRPTAVAIAPGVVAVRKIRFIAEHPGHPGDWRLHVQLGSGAGSEKDTYDFTIGTEH